jgi:hypothetical protein
MIEKLISLIGKRIDSAEVKALFAEWNVAFPKKITCTPNNSSLGYCKLKKDGLSIEFGLGGHGKLVKPVPNSKNNYIGLALFVDVDKKYQGEFPYGVTLQITAAELTKIWGEPKQTEFMNTTTTTWRKDYKNDYEVLLYEDLIDGKSARGLRVQCKWDDSLGLLADYEKAGL